MNDMMHSFNIQARRVHEANAKWWLGIHQCTKCGNALGDRCINGGEHLHPRIERNVGELLMLCVSELSEALEGHRKNLMDDKLPQRKMFEMELTDCVIRILDIAGGLGLDLGGAYEEKMAYNAVRHDHTIEGRKAADGKRY